LRNDVFVPDPSGQLITRYQITPHGASLRATRVGERTEFFRSKDEWCRPVNITTGPDGALYVCDMYRRWLDHARFFPEEFVKANDMREGEDKGRIWRIVPKGWTPKSARPSAPVITRAEHPERALLLRIPSITAPAELAAIASTYPDDAWMARMVTANAADKMGRILALLDHTFFAQFSETRAHTLRVLAAGSIAHKDDADIRAALSLLEKAPGELLWWKPALLQGLSKLPKSYTTAAAEIQTLQSQLDQLITDPAAAVEQRVAALPLLATRPWASVSPLIQRLLSTAQPAAITASTLALIKRYPPSTTAPLIYEVLHTAGPSLKRDLVPILTATASTALDLFKRMDQGEFPTAWVDIETRWRWQRGSDELATLAKKLFGQASSDRSAVVRDYMEAIKHPGDPIKGKQVFATACVACHRMGDIGVDVGPPLSDVKIKPPEALLSDILDPNRMFEARWSSYQIDTTDGRTLSGLIENETPDSIVLVMMGGLRETLPRSAIKATKSLDRSLMPPGLEASITKQQMADLLAFLNARD
jgi:putative heme-binding domain-containing protein